MGPPSPEHVYFMFCEPFWRVGLSSFPRAVLKPNLSKEIDIFYVKNVPTWERVLRVVMGLLALGFAAIHWGGSPVAIGAGVAGAVLSMTGLFGFCPMCAMVGRKLDKGV